MNIKSSNIVLKTNEVESFITNRMEIETLIDYAETSFVYYNHKEGYMVTSVEIESSTISNFKLKRTEVWDASIGPQRQI